ncbi:ABC transporter family substrate-binding protein [Mycetocola spongiae]|uniref:ABC transporter family substrate-binding protein n=1 Tax=Mycetocola spongiae TaxID=2859226 RepID=UPI001CF5F8FA|nr:ABC transporter family substrate-binding protein [Mycetocola spongiae]UCR89442.1 ABC transporter family substrate-binding protein [Mycetocola spongiae]
MRVKSWTGSIAAVAALTLALSACSGSPSDGGSSGPKEEVKVGASQINPHPVSDLKQGGSLRLALSQLPEQWNYYQTDGSLLDTATILRAVMPGAFRINAENEPVINEDYVTSAELSTEGDQKVTYKINEKAVWSDGTPITWKDFEGVWKANNGSNEEFLMGDPTGYQDVASVEKGETDQDVIVTFSTPFADWKKLFTFLYPAQFYATAADYNEGWLEKVPATAGPFQLTTDSINKTAQTVTLTPNPTWWGEKPLLDSVVFRALSGNADIDAYLNDELDAVLASSTTRFARVKDAPKNDIRVSPSSRYTHITFGSGSVLADADTRLGVQQAINRQALADTLFNGIPYDVKLLNNHMYVNTDEAYEDNAKGVVDYNPEAAAAALDKAGWKVEGDVRVKDGVKLAPRIVIPAATPVSQQLAELVQAQLAAVQAKVEIVSVPSETFFRDNIIPGNFDMTIFVWSSTGFLADSVSIYQTGENTQNYGKISTEKITDLLNQANAELDPKKLADLTNEADKLVWEEGHSLPIAQAPLVTAIRPEIANYGSFAGNYATDWTTVGWLK